MKIIRSSYIAPLTKTIDATKPRKKHALKRKSKKEIKRGDSGIGTESSRIRIPTIKLDVELEVTQKQLLQHWTYIRVWGLKVVLRLSSTKLSHISL